MTKPVFLLLPLLVLAACGPVEVDDFEDFESDDAVKADGLSSPGTWYALRRDGRRCAAPACGGWFVSAVGKSSTPCPSTGRSAAECYVPFLDLSRSGLDGLEASTARATRTLVRGRIGKVTRDGARVDTVRVNEVWVAAKAPSSMNAPFWHVRSSDAKKQASRIGVSSRRTVSNLDLAKVPEDQRRAAFAASNTAEGAVMVGSISTTGSGSRLNNTLAVTAVYLRVKPEPMPAAGRVCGSQLRGELARVADGMYFPSESDYPFTPFEKTGAGGDALDVDAFRRVAGLPASTAVETRSFAELFDRLTREESWMGPEDRERLARYGALREALEAQLEDLRVFRTGEIEVKVWILGTTACGDVAGLTTISIET